MSNGSEERPQSESMLRLRTDALDWLTVDTEIVALDARQDLYLGTNHSGAELWRALDNGATRSQLIELLIDTFDIEADRASADVDAFLHSLAEQDLLEGT